MAGGTFWSDSSVEPKRKNRWVFRLDGTQPWMIKDVKKPSLSISTVEHNFGQHTFKWPGKVKWEEVSFTVVDPAIQNMDAAKLFIEKLVGSGYLTPTSQKNSLTFMTKQKSVSVLGVPEIVQLGSDENVHLETWRLHNAFITKMDFGELNYEGDGDLVTISMSIAYDFPMLNGSKLSGAN